MDLLKEEKERLLAARKADKSVFEAKGLQKRLDEVAEKIIDLEDQFENANSENKSKDQEDQFENANSENKSKDQYIPQKGTEEMIHLEIIRRGRRYNPNTGKEEIFPRKQLFSYGEWQLFKENYKKIGYIITKVLYDPYNEAAKYVEQKN